MRVRVSLAPRPPRLKMRLTQVNKEKGVRPFTGSEKTDIKQIQHIKYFIVPCRLVSKLTNESLAYGIPLRLLCVVLSSNSNHLCPPQGRLDNASRNLLLAANVYDKTLFHHQTPTFVAFSVRVRRGVEHQ